MISYIENIVIIQWGLGYITTENFQKYIIKISLGWMNTLEKYAEFDVDTIVSSHNGNIFDPLETGNKESLLKQLQFLKVVLYFG